MQVPDKIHVYLHHMDETSEVNESRPPAPARVPALLLKVDEVADELQLGRTKVYELIRSGAISAVRIDGSTRVRRADLETFVNALPVVTAQDF